MIPSVVFLISTSKNLMNNLHNFKASIVAGLFSFLIFSNLLAQSDLDISALERGFKTPPNEAKIMMRWWWFGPTVTKPELERELRVMKAGGIGGVEIQPVYPVVLDDPGKGLKTLPFLSPEFLDALQFTQQKAKELGLRVDLTIGSGWPYGGPSVPVTQAAGRLRVDRTKVAANQRRVPLPYLSEGEKLLAIFQGMNQLNEVKDGAVWLPTNPESQSEILFFISSRTGMQVKRPAVGAEGFVLDHYDRNAIDSYLKNVGDPLLKSFAGNPPYAIFCDSLEVFNSDWTSDFLEEFQKRRGYDLKPYLPALVTNIGENTAAIRQDWGRTLNDLLDERFMIPMRDWAKKNNTRFRIQGYGLPPATIGSNAYADISEGEGAQWKVLRAARWASSANHLYGRNVTTSETWTWLHSPSFRATPLDAKAEADLHFLQGINQLIGHGWPYTAEGQEYPGWRFYAAAAFGEKNPWWIVMPDLSLYLQRTSWVLRQGQPANDIAFYLPNSDAWAGFVNGKVHYMIEALKDRIGDDVVASTLEAGYNFDFFDDDVLQQIGSVKNNSLQLGANQYKAIILSNVERIPLNTLRKLEEFAKNGGIVIATRQAPNVAPGFKATAAEQAEIKAISARLFSGANAKVQVVKNEKTELAEKLNSLLRPDFALDKLVNEIGFIHRHTENAEIYFVANSSNLMQNVNAIFRVKGLQAEIWNPLDGSIISNPAAEKADGTTIELGLEPYGSRVVIFTKRKSLKTESVEANLPNAIDFTNDWKVNINNQSLLMKRLTSWTENENTRYFSGTATYENTVNVSAKFKSASLSFGQGTPIQSTPLRNGSRTWLDAPIRDAAVVYVNDQRVGAIFCPPYSINISSFLKSGENKIRIEVANTAINYLAGHRLPDYKLLTLRYGDRFQPQDMENLQQLPSGLLGNIKLILR